jgi:hypothetical protein
MPRIVVPDVSHATSTNVGSQRDWARRSDDAWLLLSRIGAVFTVMGLADIALGWYPLGLGNSEWEFGTISGSLNALAIPTIGLYLMAASAIARGDRRAGRVIAVVLALGCITLLVLGVIYLTVIPLALKAVAGNELTLLGMRKGIAKGLLLGIGYVFLLVVAAIRTWRVRSAD